MAALREGEFAALRGLLKVSGLRGRRHGAAGGRSLPGGGGG